MATIICEICGTAYPDSEPQCPLCGYQHNPAPQEPEDMQYDLYDDYPDLEDMPVMPGSLPQDPGEMPPVDPQPMEEGPRRPIFDYDAVNPGEDPEPEIPLRPEGYVEYEDLGDGYLDADGYQTYGAYPQQPYQEPPKQKQPVALIIFLVVLNVALLAGTAFLFFQFLLPGKLSEQPPETLAAVTEAPTTVPETTVPAVPCTSLVISSTGKVELNSKGQYWLIHAKAMPEDTTDKILFFSENEDVVTVNEEGRVTAVGEGETKVAVVCGLQQMVCPVTVIYKEVEETQESLDAIMPTREETEPQETKAEETKPAETKAEEKKPEETKAEETKPAETAKPTKPVDPSITLKLKKTDILFKGMGLSAQLELDCELDPEDVEWTSAYPNIIKVENGKVTTLQYGASKVTAKYGDQEVSCVVRCVKS